MIFSTRVGELMPIGLHGVIMKLGLITGEIKRDTVEEVFCTIRGYGIDDVQFTFESIVNEELPIYINADLTKRVFQAAKTNGITISAVNGTFNMVHPDPAIREDGIRRFEVIAKSCKGLDCPMITLCTGSRNTLNKWRWHNDNMLPDAWEDLIRTTERILPVAEDYDVILGVESEAANVVNTPEKARLYLDSMASNKLKIIMDPANLFQIGDAKPEKVRSVLDNAFDLLGSDIVAAHGKDILSGDGIAFTSAGRGIIDFDYFIGLLQKTGYAGSIILHGIKSENEFASAISHVGSITLEQ